eukprot:s2095_g29.t1
MVCSLCGSAAHNAKTCKLPGRDKFLKVQKQLRQALRLSQKQQSGRRPPRLGKTRTYGKVRKQQTLKYSGKNSFTERKLKDSTRRKKTEPLPAGEDSQIDSIRTLQKLGFLAKDFKKCPHCHGNVGQLTWNNQNNLAFFRCTEEPCRRRISWLRLARWLPDKERIGGSFSPLQMLQALRQWCSAGQTKVPSAYASGLLDDLARSVGSTYKPMSWMETSLRSLIVSEAQKLMKKLQLRNNIEVDGTSLRVIRVTKCSQRFKSLVKEWIRTHPGAVQPKHWLLHLRVLGCQQRGSPGKLIWAPATPKLVVAGGKPPTESLHEIESSKLLSQLRHNSQVFPDGNKAWETACNKLKPKKRLHVKAVVHSKGEFVRTCRRRVKPSLSKLNGTQTLDRTWDICKQSDLCPVAKAPSRVCWMPISMSGGGDITMKVRTV